MSHNIMNTKTFLFLLALIMPAMIWAQTPLSEDELAAKTAAANTIGPEHDLLKLMAGKWKEETYYLLDPSQPPMKVAGTAETRMILGGRFAQLDSKSMFAGEKLERMTIFGHDNRRDVYTWDGYDSFGTYAVHAEGTFDDATRTLTLMSTEDDPLMPSPTRYKFVMRFPNKDQIDYEIWFLTDLEGQPTENKIVWATTTRVK